MAYVNHNRILTVASIGGQVHNVIIFSPVEPTTRENGGDLVNGDRWINTVEFTESIYYDGRWIKVGDLDEGGDVDGGDSTPGPEYPFVLDGGDSTPHASDVRTIDGGNSLTTDNEVILDEEEVNELISERRQVQARVDVSAAYSNIWIGNTPPKSDPNGRLGWYYSTESGDKIGWEIWTQDLNAETPISYEDLRAASLIIRASSGSYYPYFSVYTRRKNDGQDANAQYRSRINFSNTTDTAPVASTQLLTTGDATYSSYQNIEHVKLTIDKANSVGPQEADEIVKNITVSTSSGKPDGHHDFVTNEFIVDTKNEMYQIELRATPNVNNMARMLYQANQPSAIGRQNGDFWYDSANNTLHIWTGSWTSLNN